MERKFLIEHFDLSMENIVDPNDEHFVDQILMATSCAGVDIVFNTLSNKKLITTLPILCEYGRFVDINEPKSMASNQIPRNTHYINVSSLINEKTFKSIMPKLVSKFNSWFHQFAMGKLN